MPLRAFLFCLCALTLPLPGIAGPDTSEPMMLVAQPDLNSEIFGSAILFVKPLPDGTHIGFIINCPTSAKMGDLFPEDEASQKVADPLYLGGPEGYNRVFALVGKRDAAGENAMQMMPGLFLVADAKNIDHVIASDPEHARFFLGLVTWEPGQLDAELDRGLWYVDKADPKLILEKKTDGLWEELVRRSEAKAHAI
jgi:putative transcriptional regulator